MGLEHGAYCVGCCWLLFALLFPLGVMNVAVMALVTALIYAEKSLSRGRQISRLVAAALLAYGTLVVVVPTVLPTMM
jgi:predicted metal-binding membrane protein